MILSVSCIYQRMCFQVRYGYIVKYILPNLATQNERLLNPVKMHKYLWLSQYKVQKLVL